MENELLLHVDEVKAGGGFVQYVERFPMRLFTQLVPADSLRFPPESVGPPGRVDVSHSCRQESERPRDLKKAGKRARPLPRS